MLLIAFLNNRTKITLTVKLLIALSQKKKEFLHIMNKERSCL